MSSITVSERLIAFAAVEGIFFSGAFRTSSDERVCQAVFRKEGVRKELPK
jgi:hypothetical protein